MLYQTITIDGQEYTIHTPSFAALAQLKKYGYDLTKLPFDPDAGFVNSLLAVCLTDVELRENGVKNRVWTPDEVGDTIQPDEAGFAVYGAVMLLANDVLKGLFPSLTAQVALAEAAKGKGATKVPPAEAPAKGPKKIL